MTRWQIARRAGAFFAVSLWAAALTACGSSDTTSTTFSLPSGCRKVPAPPAKHVQLKRPSGKASSGAALTATVETSCRALLDRARSRQRTEDRSLVHLPGEKGRL